MNIIDKMITGNNIDLIFIFNLSWKPFMYFNDYTYMYYFFKTKMETQSLDMFKIAY